MVSTPSVLTVRPRPIVRWTSSFDLWKSVGSVTRSGASSVTTTSPTGRYNWSSTQPNARVVGMLFLVESADDWLRVTAGVSWRREDGKLRSAESPSIRARSGFAGRLFVQLPDDADLTRVVSMTVTASGLDGSTSVVSVRMLSVYTPPSTAPFPHSWLTTAGAMFQMQPRPEITVAPPSDAVVASRIAVLQKVLDWAHTWQRHVVLGEFGVNGAGDANSAAWQKLMDQYLDVADAAGLPLLRWSEGAGAPLSLYQPAHGATGRPPTVSDAKPGATSWERHLRAVPGRAVGVSLFSMAQAVTSIGDGKYSNDNIGAFGKDYKAETAATVAYLAARGHNTFRLPFRWDRVMRDPDGTLDPEQWGYYRRNVDAVMAQPGCIAVIDPHCSWGYRFPGEDDDTNSRVAAPGSSLTMVAYAHLLRLVCADLDTAGYHGRYALELTNEPHGELLSQWTSAEIAQFVVEDLRADGNDTHLLIPFYSYDAAPTIGTIYPWIDDPLGTDHHSYVVHHYFDAAGSGSYEWPPYSKVLERQQSKAEQQDGDGGSGGDGTGD